MKTPRFFHIFNSINIGVYIGIFFLIHLLISIPFLWVPEESTTNESIEMIEETGGKIWVLFASVILAPIFETFLYQFSVIKIIRFILKNAVLCFFISIPISALFFAWDHSYSTHYSLNALFIGLLYAIFFFIAQYRKELPAFLFVAILHSSWNLFAFIMDEIV